MVINWLILGRYQEYWEKNSQQGKNQLQTQPTYMYDLQKVIMTLQKDYFFVFTYS